jgi:hypothetical protein
MATLERNTGRFLRAFGAGQLHRLETLFDLAQEVTGEFYRMGAEEARCVPYEVRTLAHLTKEEIHERGVLADIARYQYADRAFGRKRDLYRVNIQDHNILQSLKRSKDRVDFSPLMLYVLTHEIVHVIRFVKFMAPFQMDEKDRTTEENQVHTITQSILARVSIPGMNTVLDRYQHLAQ